MIPTMIAMVTSVSLPSYKLNDPYNDCHGYIRQFDSNRSLQLLPWLHPSV